MIMISRKYKNLYYDQFLPLMECIFQYRHVRGQELMVNERNLAIYFDVDRRVIMSFLKEMEDTNLIKYLGNKRIFDDFACQFAMRCYDLVPTDSNYSSKLQEFINTYTLWEPYLTDRLDFIVKYTEDLREKKLQIAKSKFESGEKLSKEEKKMIKKYERNIIYQNEYSWATDLLDVINAQRPEQFRSKYLKEGRNRETNILCGTLNPDNTHEDASEQDLLERQILLATYFGTDDFIENDTNGSIYRMSYSLANKRPLSHNVDIYTAIWQKAFYGIKINTAIRNSLKLLCMPIFMSNGQKNAWNSLIVNRTGKLLKSEAARKSALNCLCEVTHLEARDVLDKITVAMRKFIGTTDFLEEEIFIHESNLHILMLAEFAKRGIKTINVYDGFYFINGTCDEQLFNEVYDLCTNQLLEKLQ